MFCCLSEIVFTSFKDLGSTWWYFIMSWYVKPSNQKRANHVITRLRFQSVCILHFFQGVRTCSVACLSGLGCWGCVHSLSGWRRRACTGHHRASSAERSGSSVHQNPPACPPTLHLRSAKPVSQLEQEPGDIQFKVSHHIQEATTEGIWYLLRCCSCVFIASYQYQDGYRLSLLNQYVPMWS